MNIFSYKKCHLATNEKFGRYIVASENIKAGDLLLTELPFVCGPHWDTKVNCLNCYAASNAICEKCEAVPLCLNCVHNHDLMECQTFQKFNLPKEFLITNFEAVMPLRFLALMYTMALNNDDPKNDLKLKIDDALSMESHCVKRHRTWIWADHEKNIVEPLIKMLKIDQQFNAINSSWKITDEFCQKICGILDVNMFEVRTKHFEDYPVMGLYVQAALMAHDCVANTMITIDECKNLKVFACVDIKAGEIVYNNYTTVLLGTQARKDHLMKGKYFECECRRCIDPTELGTHLSSIKCKSCSIGYVVHMINKWQCLNCNTIVSNQNIQLFLHDIQQQYHQIGMDINDIESFISKYSKLLHPNYYLLIEAKQKLASIIHQIIPQILHARAPTAIKYFEKLLKYKIDLCKEFISILDILQPGISRLKAITLYEEFVCLEHLARLYYQQKSINHNEYLDYLCEGEVMVKESIRLLLYESPTSPEGLLARQAMHELRDLRATKQFFSQENKTLPKTNE